MKRLITVIKLSFVIFSLLIIFFYLESLITGEAMSWDDLGYVMLYGFIVSVLFGFMDQPKLETTLIILIITVLLILILYSYWVDNQILIKHSIYLLIGVVFGRKVVRVIDLALDFEESEVKE